MNVGVSNKKNIKIKSRKSKLLKSVSFSTVIYPLSLFIVILLLIVFGFYFIKSKSSKSTKSSTPINPPSPTKSSTNPPSPTKSSTSTMSPSPIKPSEQLVRTYDVKSLKNNLMNNLMSLQVFRDTNRIRYLSYEFISLGNTTICYDTIDSNKANYRTSVVKITFRCIANPGEPLDEINIKSTLDVGLFKYKNFYSIDIGEGGIYYMFIIIYKNTTKVSFYEIKESFETYIYDIIKSEGKSKGEELVIDSICRNLI